MSMGVPKDHCHVLDWWENRRIEVTLPKENGDDHGSAKIDLHCTPSQHNVGRGFMDRFRYAKSLWASWVGQEVLADSAQVKPKSVFFAGDTGYRAVLDGQNQESVPVCEAFKQIGERFGPIDFAMIPIGLVHRVYCQILLLLTESMQRVCASAVHVPHTLFSR